MPRTASNMPRILLTPTGRKGATLPGQFSLTSYQNTHVPKTFFPTEPGNETLPGELSSTGYQQHHMFRTVLSDRARNVTLPGYF